MKVKIYQNKRGQKPYSNWLKKLKDKKAQQKIDVRIAQLRLGHLGDFKSLGSGLLELRIHFGPGYRIYCGKEGQEIIILLSAGDKSTQQKDINKAHIYWEDYKNG
jgi:putative addiction module killer protein